MAKLDIFMNQTIGFFEIRTEIEFQPVKACLVYVIWCAL